MCACVCVCVGWRCCVPPVITTHTSSLLLRSLYPARPPVHQPAPEAQPTPVSDAAPSAGTAVRSTSCSLCIVCGIRIAPQPAALWLTALLRRVCVDARLEGQIAVPRGRPPSHLRRRAAAGLVLRPASARRVLTPRTTQGLVQPSRRGPRTGAWSLGSQLARVAGLAAPHAQRAQPQTVWHARGAA